MSEESDPELKEEENIIMEDSTEDHWKDIYDDGKDRININALM